MGRKECFQLAIIMTELKNERKIMFKQFQFLVSFPTTNNRKVDQSYAMFKPSLFFYFFIFIFLIFLMQGKTTAIWKSCRRNLGIKIDIYIDILFYTI